MKIIIKRWTPLTPYRLLSPLRRVIPEGTRAAIWLEDFIDRQNAPETRLQALCGVFNRWQGGRATQIKIASEDVLDAFTGISQILHPMLICFKESNRFSSAVVDDADVPSDYANASHEERWDWVLDQMIWSFSQCLPDSDWEEQYFDECYVCDRAGMAAHRDRIDNGLRLFGKYFRDLWI